MGNDPAHDVLLDAARRDLQRGDPAAALERLGGSDEEAPASAPARSLYGLALALAERRFEEGVALCREAVRQEFFNPELYLNLARLHLQFGFKAEGLRYLRRGRMIDPANTAIVRELRALGARRPQVLRFLPRRHPINRLLGRARSWLARDLAA